MDDDEGGSVGVKRWSWDGMVAWFVLASPPMLLLLLLARRTAYGSWVSMADGRTVMVLLLLDNNDAITRHEPDGY